MVDESKRKSLWGELPKAEALRAPKVVLQEQADILYESTEGQLRGRIDTSTSPPDKIIHEFFVVAPYVNDYSVNILDVYHGALAYPAKVKNNIAKGPGLLGFIPDYECNNVEELEKALALILQSKVVRNVISSLLAQSR